MVTYQSSGNHFPQWLYTCINCPVSISHPPPTKRSFIKVLGFISLHYSKLNCIKRSPVFSSRGHLFSGPNEIFSLLPLFNGHFVKNYNCNAKDSLCMTFSGLYLPIFWHKGYAVLAKLEAKMAGHRPTFVFALSCTESKSRSTKTQKKRSQYTSILTEQAWSIRDLLYGEKELIRAVKYY